MENSKIEMSGLLIILLAWFFIGALVTVAIIWPACVIASRKEEDHE